MQVYSRIDNPLEFCQMMAKPLEVLCGAPPTSGPAIAMLMLSEGLNAIEVKRRYHFIGGQPSMRADAMLAEFRMNHGGDYEIVSNTPELAEIKFIDAKGRDYTCSFSLQELNESRWPWKDWKNHEAGYKDNYGTPTDRKAMLFNRLVSDSLRRICPELVAGVYTPEEVVDMGPAVKPEEKRPAPSVNDLLQQSQAANPVDDGDAIDASFVVVDEATDDQPVDPSSPGTVTNSQHDRIVELFDRLQLSQDKRHEVLAKRQASVVRNLSRDDAAGLVDRLAALAQEKGVEAAPAGE